MNIQVAPPIITTLNGTPFMLTTTINDCAPGAVTVWYSLPLDGPCEFVTPLGGTKSVSHTGIIVGTSGTVRAALIVACPAPPTATTLDVVAQDSAGETARDQIVVQLR